jgi:hypothetical protein
MIHHDEFINKRITQSNYRGTSFSSREKETLLDTKLPKINLKSEKQKSVLLSFFRKKTRILIETLFPPSEWDAIQKSGYLSGIEKELDN